MVVPFIILTFCGGGGGTLCYSSIRVVVVPFIILTLCCSFIRQTSPPIPRCHLKPHHRGVVLYFKNIKSDDNIHLCDDEFMMLIVVKVVCGAWFLPTSKQPGFLRNGQVWIFVVFS